MNIDVAKCICHEYRHFFQLLYVDQNDDCFSKVWKKEFKKYNDYKNEDDYLMQSIEVDAFAFTKYYLEKNEEIKVINKVKGLDEILDQYIEKYLK